MMKVKKMNKWNIWINAGKEIFDGMAIDPKGELSRIKVSANGKLRGKIKNPISANLFQIEQAWGVNEDLFSDYNFSLLGESSVNIKVSTFNVLNSTLSLTSGSNRINAGDEFEIFTNERPEVLATRILTKTLLKDEFPLLEMQPQLIKNVNSLCPMLITSTGFLKHRMSKTLNHDQKFVFNMKKIQSLFDVLIEVEGGIDDNGVVLAELKENKINDMLREVFKFKPGLVVIALMNASKNPLHEKTILNLLKTAGIKNVFASHLI